MGNIISQDFHHDYNIYSVDNKQMPIENQQSRKKRSLIFTTVAWKRLVEATKRKGTKGSKMNPDNVCSTQDHHHIKPQPSNDVYAERNDKNKSQSFYVINTKIPAGLSNGVIATKPVLQQPRSISVDTRSNDPVKSAMQGLYNTFPIDQSERLKVQNSSKRTQANTKLANKPSLSCQSSTQPTHSDSLKDAPKSSIRVISSTVQDTTPHRKYVIQASTAELLECLGSFICRRCHQVQGLEPIDVTTWVRGVDRALLLQGWQDITFIMPSSVCFVYMLCCEMVPESAATVFEVQCILLTCLYMSYSYMGNEISYPLRPFLIEPERFAFWSRCCKIIAKLSGKMLQINSDANFFTTIFRDLKSYSPRMNAPSAYYYHKNSSSCTPKVKMPRAITVRGSAM